MSDRIGNDNKVFVKGGAVAKAKEERLKREALAKAEKEAKKKAEEEAQELLNKYGEQIKNEEQRDAAGKHEHKCNCNGSCGGNCKCHPKKEK